MIPSAFIAHGSPMIAIEDSEYTRFLDSFGHTFPRPKAIVIFTAHWGSDVQMVSEVEEYSTIYDFGGFPDALYQIKYPAKGNKELSRKIQDLLSKASIPFQVETRRGLDHGAWNLLYRLYPAADIPVIAMSVNPDMKPEEHFQIGKALSPLRKEDVLIIGSGATVHNFSLFSKRSNPEVKDMVLGFENWLEDHLHKWDVDSLFHYETKAPNARIAVPQHGEEHFVPIFYAMGAADDSHKVSTLHRSLLMDVLTNSVYQFG
jgi:4,5-DOPA dioxygenase extradiol